MPEQRHLVLPHLRTATALATALSFLLTQEVAYALPTGGQVAAGSATIANAGNTTTINQSSTRAILNWLGFDVGSGETVNFNQPSASAITLNRVIGGSASQIQGAINANGQVWIVNPQGVLFGAGSQVNVGGLLATASDIDDSRFMSGDYTFDHAGSATASISNAGHIHINDGGLAALVGPNVSNSGVITATLGKVQLGSGNTFALDLYGDGLINLQAGPDITSQLIDNSGTIAADGGNVLLTTAAAENSINGLVNLDGVINAGDITIDGVAVSHTGQMNATGNVTITAKNIAQQGDISASTVTETFTGAYIDNAGSQTTASNISIVGGAGSTLFASGGYTAPGGTISMAAENMWLYAAALDASGTGGLPPGASAQGGGSILLGDNNTQNVSVNFYSSLKADALTSGDGGHIKVWSTNSTTFGAATSARGGATSGNGGLIEISSAGQDYVGGNTPDVSAPHGNAGTFLLDPHNITIADTSTTGGGLVFFPLTDPDPSGANGGYGQITVLGNGNIVVANYQDSFAAANAGAVYLFNGATGALISTLTGSRAGDEVGYGRFGRGITTLTGNNNFVINSPNWANSAATAAGAVTWASGTTGVSGTVSSSNSLIGSQSNDGVGGNGITTLTNGNYVVDSVSWDNGATVNVGAVTWGNGATGITGAVSSSNSLVGSQSNDKVGGGGAYALTNGNYVVDSYQWANGAASNAGAVTWGNGTTGITGAVSSSNSLVGSQSNDKVGGGTNGFGVGITILSNGNYVVDSAHWANGAATQAGAVTWGNGTAGVTGTISSGNSLIGSQAGDAVGIGGVTALSSGNYVVSSYDWSNGATSYVGAVTWVNGSNGVTSNSSNTISSANSLVGNSANDGVGYGYNSGTGGVTVLSNGNYVVDSPFWDNGAIDSAGAVTWGNGVTGTTGTVSAANSLVGSQTFDQVGIGGITALTNGNYVVSSYSWNNGAVVSAGAVTWGDGTGGTTVGAVSSSNSLVGSHTSDDIGYGDNGTNAIITLSNGNYVVDSPFWDNGAVSNAGAATWGNGAGGTTGAISSSNSLVGSQANDEVGEGSGFGFGNIVALTNGNYVVTSANWANGAAAKAGAVTWGSGTAGITGAVSSSNSLVGSHANDQVGIGSVIDLSNGNYVVRSYDWANGAVTQAGAVTWGNGTTGITGAVSAANSLVGSQTGDEVSVNGIIALSNSNYVVISSVWANGAATKAGAVTWGNGVTGITGAVSSSNSLVGSTASDQIGSGGITALSGGNYVVISPLWDNGATADAGAAAWGSGTTGVTGTISTANSIIGPSASAGLGGIVEDSAEGTFIVPFTTAGKIYVSPSSGDINSLTFGSFPGTDFTVDTAYLAAALSAGTAVTLQANNDITLSNNLTVTGGAGGWLTLDAGRSILLNANIDTSNGILTLRGNEPLAAGVTDAQRDAGNAVITMAGGTSINAGSGVVTFDLKTGSGLTNHAAGDVTLNTISAAAIVARNENSSGDVIANGQLTASSTGSAITLVSGRNFINNYGASLFSLTGGGRWLSYSTDPSADTIGGLNAAFTLYSCIYGGACGAIPGTGNGFLYAIAGGSNSALTPEQSRYFSSASQWISDLSDLITADPLNTATQRRDTTPPVLLNFAEALFSPRYSATPYYIYNPYGDGNGLLHGSLGCDGEGCRGEE